MGSEQSVVVLFECQGRPVHKGDRLFVAPQYAPWAGVEVEAYCEVIGGSAVFHTIPYGAVPTLPITAVSWAPHPDTVDLERKRSQGIVQLTSHDLRVWRSGRDARAPQPTPNGKG